MFSSSTSIISKIYFKVKEKTVGVTLPQYQQYKAAFNNKQGIEIGGPSRIFQGKHYWPVYPDAGSLDGVNFSDDTIWEGKIQAGEQYTYATGKQGIQYIMEAGDLSLLDNDSYDFLISSHCLEHCANPVSVLLEWKRIVKKAGFILIVVPDQRFTFDWKRPVTTFSHLLEDFHGNTTEQDLTHLDEILRLHDLTRDPGAGSFDDFKSRSLANFSNRGLHHHVFDLPLMTELFTYTGIKVLMTEVKYPHHLIILGQKQ